MKKSVWLLATLAAMCGVPSTTLADNTASFTFRGIVPVSCDNEIEAVRVTDGRADIRLNQKCNTRHALTFTVGTDPEASVQAEYNGVPFTLSMTGQSLPQGWYVDEVRNLTLVAPGASAAEMERYVASLSVQLSVG